jgi:hypothetical protein
MVQGTILETKSSAHQTPTLLEAGSWISQFQKCGQQISVLYKLLILMNLVIAA